MQAALVHPRRICESAALARPVDVGALRAALWLALALLLTILAAIVLPLLLALFLTFLLIVLLLVGIGHDGTPFGEWRRSRMLVRLGGRNRGASQCERVCAMNAEKSKAGARAQPLLRAGSRDNQRVSLRH